jgi:hypothetical protein
MQSGCNVSTLQAIHNEICLPLRSSSIVRHSHIELHAHLLLLYTGARFLLLSVQSKEFT